jgi:hypothetical protein
MFLDERRIFISIANFQAASRSGRLMKENTAKDPGAAQNTYSHGETSSLGLIIHISYTTKLFWKFNFI